MGDNKLRKKSAAAHILINQLLGGFAKINSNVADVLALKNNLGQMKPGFIKNSWYRHHAGSSKKTFGVAHISHFKSMVEDIACDNPYNYQTCINEEIIYGDDLPEYIPVVIKYDRGLNSHTRYCNFVEADLMASKIAGLFGVRTACVQPAKELAPNEKALVSVCFLRAGQHFCTATQVLSGKLLYHFYNGLADWLQEIEGWFDKTIRMTGEDTMNIEMDIIGDMIQHYVVRSLILNDTDFSSNNLGIILGDSIDMLDIQLAPMFDLEYSFQGMKNYNNDDWVNRIPNDWLSDLPRLKKDLTAVAKKYRHFLDKAIKSLDVENIADKIREIVSPYDSQPDRYVKFICGRINTIKQIYKEVCNDIVYYSDIEMSI